MCFASPIEINKSLGYEIKSIINLNDSLAAYTVKNEISQLLFRYRHKYEKTQLFIKKLFITMLLYCLKYRKNTESKNPKVVKKKPRKNNAFIKLCDFW